MAFSLNGYLLSVATANNLAADDNDDGLMPATFQQWKGEYDESYTTTEEEHNHFEVYTGNVRYIESTNC
jgi:hypothetical protein